MLKILNWIQLVSNIEGSLPHKRNGAALKITVLIVLHMSVLRKSQGVTKSLRSFQIESIV